MNSARTDLELLFRMISVHPSMHYVPGKRRYCVYAPSKMERIN